MIFFTLCMSFESVFCITFNCQKKYNANVNHMQRKNKIDHLKAK